MKAPVGAFGVGETSQTREPAATVLKIAGRNTPVIFVGHLRLHGALTVQSTNVLNVGRVALWRHIISSP